jgi:hypothetical protein
MQMKSFCTSLEQDSKQLRKQIESKQSSEKYSKTSVEHLFSKAEDLSARVALAEETILGPLETRLSHVMLDEVVPYHYFLKPYVPYSAN